MAVLAVGLGTVLATIIVPLIVKVLLAFGLGFVTYTGVNLLLGELRTMMIAQFSVSGFDQVINLLAYMNADKAITMMLSAVTIRATLRGLQAGGTLRRFGSLPTV